MKKKIKGFRVDDSFDIKFKKNMEEENRRRTNNNEKPLNENDCIVYINDYFYEHETDPTARIRREEKDAQHYAGITKSLVEKYFRILSDELELLAAKVSEIEIYTKIISASESILDNDSDSSINRFAARIEEEEKTARRIKSVYDLQNRKKDNLTDERKKTKGEKDDEREFF